MKILPVTDPAFAPYGRVVEGYPVEGILAALAGLAFVMIHFLNWGLIPVFAVLAVLLAAAAIGAYKLLMKNVKKYYFAG